MIMIRGKACLHTLFLLLATSSFVATAQGQHMIHLAKAKAVDVPAGLYVDSVITSFADDARIGTVLKGVGNNRMPAFLTNGVTTAVQEILKNGATAPGSLHCTMRINALEVGELVDGPTEFCSCGLDFELLTFTDSGWCRIYDHAATTKRPGGMDATAKQPESIAAAFASGMAAYAAAQREGSLIPVPLGTPPQRGRYRAGEHIYPVLESGAPARGLYRTFRQFRHQMPDTVTQFTVKTKATGDGRLVKLKPAKGGESAETYWGFSDGEHAYVNTGRGFLRLDRDGDRFISQYTRDPNLAVGVAVGAMFGVLGAVLYVAASPSEITIPLDLDLMTGALKPRAHAENDTAVETSDHLFLYSKYSDQDTVLQMFVYGGPEATLTLDSYRVLKIVPRPGEVPVGFSLGDGDPVVINIGTSHIGPDPLVYLLRVRKNRRITIDRVNDEMAASILRKLDPGKEVE